MTALSRRAARIATALLAGGSHLLVLAAPAFADPMANRAAEGRGFGLSIFADPSTMAVMTEADVLRLFPGAAAETDIDLGDLFPAYGAETPIDPGALFGDDAALRASSGVAAAALQTGTTAQSDAWAVTRATQSRAGVDLREDPMFDATKATIGTLDTLAARFTDCGRWSDWTPHERLLRTTTERTCLRAATPDRVETVTHDVNLTVSTTSLTLLAPPRATRVEVDFRVGEARVSWETVSTREVCRDSGGSSESGGSTVCIDETVVTPRVSRAAIPAWDEAAFCGAAAKKVASVFREHVAIEGLSRTIGPGTAPGCANGLTYAAAISGAPCATRALASGDGGTIAETVCPAGSIELEFAIATVDADDWGPAETVDGLVALERGGCAPRYLTLSGAEPGSTECLQTGGGEICPGDAVWALLTPPPFDPGETRVSRLATRVDADLSACRPVVPAAENCAALRADPACAYRTTWAVAGDGATEAALFEDVYDCETARSVATAAPRAGLSCPGPVRGIGDDLVAPVVEANASFAEVASRLSATTFMAMDTACGDAADPSVDPMQCMLFKGEGRTCKRAIFGVVDCCQSPGGVSLVQYLQLAFAMAEIDGAIQNLDATSPIRGAWELLPSPFADAWAYASRNFASGVNSIAGTELVSVSDVAAKGLVSTIQNELLQQTAQWTASVFGDAAANALFVSAKGLPQAFTGGVMVEGGVMLGPELALAASVLSYVMLAYTIYNVALLIASIVWSCSEDELETAVKRELRSCRYNGTYCSSSALGVCLERRRSYCCFASPLSRILQEQARLQTGRSWGSARTPDCAGFTVAEMSAIDFSAVDLSEWTSILLETGVMPDGLDATLDAMTGSGSVFAGALPGGMTRLDVAGRTVGRAAAGAIDADAIAGRAREAALGDRR